MTLIYKVFYHYPCNDGELARIIWERSNPNSVFYKWNYSNMEETCNILNSIIEKDIIIFLDVCPKLELLSKIHHYTIIDHHMNAINCMENDVNFSKYNISMFCNIMKSGCMLTWEYCNKNIIYPTIVKHIGNKDIWNFTDKMTEPYCIGFNEHMNNYTMNTRMSIIKLLIDDERMVLHNQFIKIGEKNIKINTEKANKYFYNNTLTNETVDGTTYNIIDIECNDSTMYKYLIDHASLNYNNMDVLRVLHTKKDDRDVYSVRSLKEHIVVDGIARKYNGNGHPKAAGYTLMK